MKLKIFTIIAALAISVAVNAQNNKNQNNMENKKALVVFFSHAGENYSVGNIKVGNTKIVADYISELTGADQFEIVTHKYDGMAYTPLTRLAQDEQNNNERPPFEGVLTTAGGSTVVKEHNSSLLEQYDVVFIGGPVWWGTYPQVMFTFFDTYNLNGKTIYTFTTHEGSGLGSTVKDVKDNYPHADVQRGFSIYGHEVRTGKEKVEKWINAIGL